MNKRLRNSILILAILTIGYFFADTILFDGVKPVLIKDAGFRASFFAKKTTKDKATIVLVGGRDWGAYWGQELAKANYMSLSLPYHREEGLPALPEEIPLEYFGKAFRWLKNQPQVNSNEIIVMGASRNAELALVIASTFTESISGVVAYAPSAVSWSNTVLPYNSNEIKSSWKYKGVDIPYVPMNKITGNKSNKIKTIEYWNSGLAKKDFLQQASIKVEKINGPILLFSGNDDRVWPSSRMADMIEKRLNDNGFKHPLQNIKYDNAGHLISSNPDNKSSDRTGTMNIDGKEYEFEYGGNDDGDYKAKQDAKIKLMEFPYRRDNHLK